MKDIISEIYFCYGELGFQPDLTNQSSVQSEILKTLILTRLDLENCQALVLSAPERAMAFGINCLTRLISKLINCPLVTLDKFNHLN